MRSFLLALAFTPALALDAQPVDWPKIRARMEPAICHGHTRSGIPSAPLYHLSDTIVLTITGHVKLDGSCGGSAPLYGFQRKEGDAWVDYLPPCNVQLCCGMPSEEWVKHTVGLVPAQFARPSYGKPWVPGEYRVVIMLVGDKELVGPPFSVEAGE